MPDSWPTEIDLAAYVADAETAPVKLTVPVPIVVLAADLLQRVPRRTAVRNVSELVAALLVRASQKTEDLEDIIGDYRETRAYSILDPTGKGMFPIPPRSEIELG